MATCLGHSTPRMFKSFKYLNSVPRYYSSSTDKSTYYVQRFINATEHYILLLPKSSLPMGRMYIRELPEKVSMVRNGPTIDFIDPISTDLIQQDWSTFVENGGFRTILQDVIRENIDQDEMVINDAKTLQGGEGWVHLCDERALPAFGRIPEVDDIIGSVLVKNNEIQPETYQPMPTYRLVTPDGPMKLSSFLLEKLREKLNTDSDSGET